MIEINGVSKIFRKNGKDIMAMQETSLSIEEGRFVSIIGPSGCGKSTLFNIIAGLVPPSTGQVLAGGTNIIGKTGHVGYMLQKDMLL
ncbi:ATP-binding cassette domain-containing protein, partial [Paenibacillus sepulcri]|nr:ATP-binding cassette domain-containing protein [Paenibacillus sepulcri]